MALFMFSPFDDPIFWNNRRFHDEEKRSYYGISGLQRMSNLTILLICLTFTAVLSGLQIYFINYAAHQKKAQLVYVSQVAEENLKRTHDAADKLGNDGQLERLRLRFEEHEAEWSQWQSRRSDT